MTLWERIIDQRLRDIVSVSDGQFGFKPGFGTTDAIFVIRTLCEKYRDGNKPIYIYIWYSSTWKRRMIQCPGR